MHAHTTYRRSVITANFTVIWGVGLTGGTGLSGGAGEFAAHFGHGIPTITHAGTASSLALLLMMI